MLRSVVLDAIGSLLPLAAGIALSPFPVIAVVLVLASPGGRNKGLAFLVGWLIGLGVLTALCVALLEGTDDSAGSRAAADWLRLLLGGALLYGAAVKWRTRPSPGIEPELPGWMASIDGLSVAGAARLGGLLGGVNPKNIAFAVAAASTVVELVEAGGSQVVAATIFVLLSSSTVVGLVATRLVAGERATTTLDGVRVFMIRNANVITMVVLVILGAVVAGEGLAGLTA
jgi:threonine/homoserine/homoserine lactone efflux protein